MNGLTTAARIIITSIKIELSRCNHTILTQSQYINLATNGEYVLNDDYVPFIVTNRRGFSKKYVILGIHKNTLTLGGLYDSVGEVLLHPATNLNTDQALQLYDQIMGNF